MRKYDFNNFYFNFDPSARYETGKVSFEEIDIGDIFSYFENPYNIEEPYKAVFKKKDKEHGEMCEGTLVEIPPNMSCHLRVIEVKEPPYDIPLGENWYDKCFPKGIENSINCETCINANFKEACVHCPITKDFED